MSASLAGGEDEFELIRRQNLETICSYGENLMEVVCRDVCNNHDVGKVSDPTGSPADIRVRLNTGRGGKWSSNGNCCNVKRRIDQIN